MRTFKEIYAIAAKRKGAPATLEKLIAEHKPKSRAALAKIPDDRWLAEMTACVFRAGFSWSVIDKKWPGFEKAFWKFNPKRCAAMSDKDLDALLKDKGIVRNAAKILSVRDNAIWLSTLAKEHGSAAKLFADWPDEDYAGLLELLKKEGARLGGNAGMMAMRFMGKPSFVLSQDVVARLVAERIVDKAPTSKGTMRKVQAAFNQWAEESGRDLTVISRTLAMSIGD
ncbi:MAG: DNA-3-methyladenine glycosylase I [Alphaproteobacteria bacterium]